MNYKSLILPLLLTSYSCMPKVCIGPIWTYEPRQKQVVDSLTRNEPVKYIPSIDSTLFSQPLDSIVLRPKEKNPNIPSIVEIDSLIIAYTNNNQLQHL